ncbi:DUF5335 family protein [Lentzea sp. NPDC060358]|uniref:DUF5335 family protein n=1 Tax=Lentzea sp. NPDC060358 TaxID=3347103 RepID=UPI0036603933
MILAADDWKGALDEVTAQVKGKMVTIEVLDRAIGDQPEVERLPFNYAAYDTKDDVAIVVVDDDDARYPLVLRHMVWRPVEITVSTDFPEPAVRIVEQDGTTMPVTFHAPAEPIASRATADGTRPGTVQAAAGSYSLTRPATRGDRDVRGHLSTCLRIISHRLVATDRGDEDRHLVLIVSDDSGAGVGHAGGSPPPTATGVRLRAAGYSPEQRVPAGFAVAPRCVGR